MTSFKQFLDETSDIEPSMSEAQLVDCAETFLKYCAGYKLDGAKLYRKQRSLGVLHTKQREKSFGGTAQIWTWMYEGMPEWKDFPDRRKSIFCASSPDHIVWSHAGGRAKIIIPFDRVKLAISQRDFNMIEVDRGNGESNLLRYYQNSIDAIRGNDSETTSNFLQLIKDSSSKARDLGWIHDAQTLTWMAKNLVKFTPEGLHIRLETTPWNPDGIFAEIWFEGGYLAIPMGQFEAFKNKVNEIKHAN